MSLPTSNDHQISHAAPDNFAAPVELLHTLEAAHSQLSAWQVEMGARQQQLGEDAAQARVQFHRVQSALESLQGEIERVRGENMELQGKNERLLEQNARLDSERRAQCDHLVGKLEERNADLEEHKSALQEHRDALQEHKNALQERAGELDQHKAHIGALGEVVEQHEVTIQEHVLEIERRTVEIKKRESEIKKRESEIEQRDQKIEQRDAEIAERDQEIQQRHEELRDRNDKLRYQIERNHELHDQLLKVYEDLTASDLPTLILRVCVNLTHSEHGLFVEADGDGTLAEIGQDDMPEEIRQSLYKFTRQVAQSNEPLIENNSKKLPDGSNLVNLAAMPVTLHSTLKGVILVANKRDANYTDEDTEMLLAIGRHAGLAMENRRLHSELGAAFESTISVLADAIEAKDAYTRGHCESVARLAVDVARRLGLPEKTIDHVRYAALLHDIGKIGVPDGVLLKPGKLSPEEFQMIQRHSMIGRDLVSRVPSLSAIAPIVLHHHERIDGTGYPDGLKGEAIDLTARIICVVDAFDAMTTPRPYREPVSPQEALAELRRCQNTHFDETVVDAVGVILQERGTPVRGTPVQV